MIKFILLIGGKGKGKTYLTKKKYLIRDILESNILIYDYFNEYLGIKEIKPSKISELCKQKIKCIRRIVPNQQLTLDNEIKIFLTALKDFKEGIFIGDAFVNMNKSNQLNDEIYNMLIRSKHTEEDLRIVLHFQDKNSIPKKWLVFDIVSCLEI